MSRNSVMAVIAIGLCVLLCIGCANKPAPTAVPQVNESALPSLAAVQKVASNVSNIAPVYQDRFIRTVVAWTVTFNKENLSGNEQVKTVRELNEFDGKIQMARKTVSTLKNQGCEQISVAPFTGRVSAKIDAATITGNAATDQYNIYGPEEFVSATKGWTEWDIWKADHTKIGQFAIEDDHTCKGSDGFDCGDWYRLRYSTNIDEVSKKNVEALKLQVKQLNITLTF